MVSGEAAWRPVVSDKLSSQLGIVIAGRNEGERLSRCLRSVSGTGIMVYVDSRSTDGSVAVARAFAASVVELDLTTPFTAARARNAGIERLRQTAPSILLIQFVDGDCEVVPGWIRAASDFFERRPDVGVVCGRLRERFLERSIYNRLCDMEWDTPVGEALSCGGIAMMRSAAPPRRPSIVKAMNQRRSEARKALP